MMIFTKFFEFLETRQYSGQISFLYVKKYFNCNIFKNFSQHLNRFLDCHKFSILSLRTSFGFGPNWSLIKQRKIDVDKSVLTGANSLSCRNQSIDANTPKFPWCHLLQQRSSHRGSQSRCITKHIILSSYLSLRS